MLFTHNLNFSKNIMNIIFKKKQLCKKTTFDTDEYIYLKIYYIISLLLLAD